jgi:hypothetical protein
MHTANCAFALASAGDPDWHSPPQYLVCTNPLQDAATAPLLVFEPPASAARAFADEAAKLNASEAIPKATNIRMRKLLAGRVSENIPIVLCNQRAFDGNVKEIAAGRLKTTTVLSQGDQALFITIWNFPSAESLGGRLKGRRSPLVDCPLHYTMALEALGGLQLW